MFGAKNPNTRSTASHAQHTRPHGASKAGEQQVGGPARASPLGATRGAQVVGHEAPGLAHVPACNPHARRQVGGACDATRCTAPTSASTFLPVASDTLHARVERALAQL